MKVLRHARVIIKIILIILIVAAVIAGTTFLFFHFLKKDEDSYKTTYSSERTDLIAQVEFVKLQHEANEARFDTIIKLDKTLEDIATNLFPFLKSVDVNDKAIIQRYNKVQSQSNICAQTFAKYKQNCSDLTFPRDKGANDVFVNVTNYLISYADLINYTSAEVANNLPTKNVEVALYLNQVYTDVVIATLSDTVVQEEIRSYKDLFNLEVFDDFIASDGFKDYYINTTITSNYFIDTYNKIDHSNFAKNLAALIATPNEEPEGVAATNLKKLIGVEG